MEDTEIIELLYAHQEDGVIQTKNKYENLLKHISKNIVKNDEDAIECVNDTYMKIWDTIPPYVPTYLKAFICKVVRQLSINKYKYNHRKERDSNISEAIEELNFEIISKNSVEQEVFSNNLSNEINTFVMNLKLEEQTLFIRKYFMCETTKELSMRFNITENNINVMMHRVREKLKKYLMNNGYEIN